jgi:hypothetical protein
LLAGMAFVAWRLRQPLRARNHAGVMPRRQARALPSAAAERDLNPRIRAACLGESPHAQRRCRGCGCHHPAVCQTSASTQPGGPPSSHNSPKPDIPRSCKGNPSVKSLISGPDLAYLPPRNYSGKQGWVRQPRSRMRSGTGA